jgi:predicted dehydrogenase
MNSAPAIHSRRRFLAAGLTLAAGTLAMARSQTRSPRPAPSNRITLGVIGCGNQGMNDIRGFLRDPRIQIVAVCDVNRESSEYWSQSPGGRDVARREVEAHEAQFTRSGNYDGCAVFSDYRELLAREDIDTVLIDTPDHWHARQVVDAVAAGKDIYCQKPLSLTIDEGKIMRDAVRRRDCVFQTGSQQRSAASFSRAVNLVRNGYIGRLTEVRVGLPGGRPDFALNAHRKQPEPVPEGFDYDFWLGPAPRAPYAPARCHVSFRWIYDYSGGQVTDWGAHHVDCAMWGGGVDRTGPVEIRNLHAEFEPDPLWNTATAFHFEAHFAGGLKIDVSSERDAVVEYVGTNGTVTAERERLRASDPALLRLTWKDTDELTYESRDHFLNFVDCVMARKETAAPVEVAHRAITTCHLANIAMRLGRKRLRWDPVHEQVIGDEAAAGMLSRPYRAPWQYPTA